MVEVKIVEGEASKSASGTAEGERDERIREDSTWRKNVENDTPRIRSSSSSSSSKSKCHDSEKIEESDASTEPPRSSSSRPVETAPSVSSSKDMHIKDEAVMVHLFVCLH